MNKRFWPCKARTLATCQWPFVSFEPKTLVLRKWTINQSNENPPRKFLEWGSHKKVKFRDTLPGYIATNREVQTAYLGYERNKYCMYSNNIFEQQFKCYKKNNMEVQCPKYYTRRGHCSFDLSSWCSQPVKCVGIKIPMPNVLSKVCKAVFHKPTQELCSQFWPMLKMGQRT